MPRAAPILVGQLRKRRAAPGNEIVLRVAATALRENEIRLRAARSSDRNQELCGRRMRQIELELERTGRSALIDRELANQRMVLDGRQRHRCRRARRPRRRRPTQRAKLGHSRRRRVRRRCRDRSPRSSSPGAGSSIWVCSSHGKSSPTSSATAAVAAADEAGASRAAARCANKIAASRCSAPAACAERRSHKSPSSRSAVSLPPGNARSAAATGSNAVMSPATAPRRASIDEYSLWASSAKPGKPRNLPYAPAAAASEDVGLVRVRIYGCGRYCAYQK